MAGDASDGLARLMAAQDDGRLDQLCVRHGLQVLTLFGSAATQDPTPADLDLAYRSAGSTDHLRLLDDLVQMTGEEHIDLVDLRHADPVVAQRALAGTGLFEDRPGRFVGMRELAQRIYMDTAHVRRAQLEALST